MNKVTEPHSSVSSIQDLRTGDCWFDPRAWSIFFPTGFIPDHKIRDNLTSLFFVLVKFRRIAKLLYLYEDAQNIQVQLLHLYEAIERISLSLHETFFYWLNHCFQFGPGKFMSLA